MGNHSQDRDGSTLEPAAVGLFFAIAGIMTVLYGARNWYPEVASEHGVGIDAMLNFLLLVTGAMIVIGHVALGYFIWRAGNQDRVTQRMTSPKTEYRLTIALGLVMSLAAEGGVVSIGLPVWAAYHSAPEDSLVVEVTGQQFAWNIRYPGEDGVFGRTDPNLVDDAENELGLVSDDPAGSDDVVSVNQMYLPVDRPVKIRLRSKDVIHSFFVPHMRVKQDAVPGMSPEIVFTPSREGRFPILCAELCGLAHYRMQGSLTVVSEAEFDKWLEEQREADVY